MRSSFLSFILLFLITKFAFGEFPNITSDTNGFELLKMSNQIIELNIEDDDIFWSNNTLIIYLSAKIRLSKYIPKSVTPQILVYNISNFLTKNPQKLHLNAFDLIDEACKEVYYKIENKKKIPIHKKYS